MLAIIQKGKVPFWITHNTYINNLLNYYIENDHLNLTNNITYNDLILLVDNINKYNIIIKVINMPNDFKYTIDIKKLINVGLSIK